MVVQRTARYKTGIFITRGGFKNGSGFSDARLYMNIAEDGD